MIILTILVVLLVAGAWWQVNASYDSAPFGGTVAALAGFCLFIALLGLWLSRACDRSEIEQFKAVRAVVMDMRQRGDDVERAAIAHKIAEQNGWLARAQYWNATVWDIWTVDEVDDLEPIR